MGLEVKNIFSSATIQDMSTGFHITILCKDQFLHFFLLNEYKLEHENFKIHFENLFDAVILPLCYFNISDFRVFFLCKYALFGC